MRASDFISEGIVDVQNIQDEYNMDPKLVDIALQIRKTCKPFLNQVPIASSMYRGMNESKLVLHKNVRLDVRVPLNSNGKLHTALNAYFNERFGEPFRNALFVSGDLGEANQYGDPYFIFPEGDFNFLWSPYIEDLWTEWNSRPGRAIAADDEEIESFINNTIVQGRYRQDNLDHAIHANREIMIRSKSYYAIHTDILKDEENFTGFEEILAL